MQISYKVLFVYDIMYNIVMGIEPTTARSLVRTLNWAIDASIDNKNQ